MRSMKSAIASAQDDSFRENRCPVRFGESGVVISRGEVWWAELGLPRASERGSRRPLVVVQGDALNRSGTATVVCVR
jgi:hypothetical protein